MTSLVWYQPLIGPLVDKRIGVEKRVCDTCHRDLYMNSYGANSKGYVYRHCKECMNAKDKLRMQQKRAS